MVMCLVRRLRRMGHNIITWMCSSIEDISLWRMEPECRRDGEIGRTTVENERTRCQYEGVSSIDHYSRLRYRQRLSQAPQHVSTGSEGSEM